jgi:hypothetical protein
MAVVSIAGTMTVSISIVVSISIMVTITVMITIDMTTVPISVAQMQTDAMSPHAHPNLCGSGHSQCEHRNRCQSENKLFHSCLHSDPAGAAPAVREQNQLRRPMTPINTPMATAPANAPKGLRRAMLSSSVAKVFA